MPDATKRETSMRHASPDTGEPLHPIRATENPASHTGVRSMHEDVPVWCDCCSCAAEPYWLEAMEEGANQQPPGPAVPSNITVAPT